MSKLIVDVECGPRECGGCHLWGEDWQCLAFNKTLEDDGTKRLPACLAGEADLTRLVKAARELNANQTRGFRLHDVTPELAKFFNDAWEELQAALAPFEEAHHG